MSDPGSRWTREDSRYVDERLGGAARAHYEHGLASDPIRRERLERWRTAMDLWREDAAGLAGALDAGSLTRRVLAGRPTFDEALRRAAWRYAAAAVLLLGVGLAGSAALGPHPARAADLDPAVGLRVLERERFAHQERVAWEIHPFIGRHLEERDH